MHNQSVPSLNIVFIWKPAVVFRFNFIGVLDFNPSYTKLFRTRTLYQVGGGGLSSGPPTISSTLGCKIVKFCKVLEISFKVSENTRFVKNFYYGYHGNYLITWFFPLIIVKTMMKNRQFSNAPRNHKLEGVKIALCVMVVLFLYLSKK